MTKRLKKPAPENVISGWLMEFNQKYAFVLKGGNQRIAHFTQGRFSGFITVEAFLNLVKRIRVKGVAVGDAGIGAVWLKHQHRRTFEEITFSPLGSCPPHVLNVWGGFAVKPQRGDVEPCLDFLRTIVCSGNEELFRYVLAWLAHLVQRPNEKPGTALVLRGAQGTGKSTLALMVMGLFGPHALMLPSAASMTRNFNSHLFGKVVVVIEETPVHPREANIVKQIVTQPTLFCEPKGIDGFEVENHIHLILCTNEHRAVFAQHDERRYVVMDISNARKEDTAYFASLNAWYENGGSSALLEYLQRYDWTDVNLRSAPRTTGLLEQKVASLPLIDRALYSMLQTGMVSSSREWEQPQSRSLFVDTINEEFRQRHEQSVSVEQVGKRLKALFPGLRSYRETRGSRGWLWTLPPLEHARGEFERHLGQPIDWDTEIED